MVAYINELKDISQSDIERLAQLCFFLVPILRLVPSMQYLFIELIGVINRQFRVDVLMDTLVEIS